MHTYSEWTLINNFKIYYEKKYQSILANSDAVISFSLNFETFSTKYWTYFITSSALLTFNTPSRCTIVKFNFLVEYIKNSITEIAGNSHCPPQQYEASTVKSLCSKGAGNLKVKDKESLDFGLFEYFIMRCFRFWQKWW